MTINDFKKIINPPTLPHEVPSETILKDFETINTLIPDDYKDYIVTYGTGTIDEFIWIFNPASSNPNLNLNRQIDIQLESLRKLINKNQKGKYNLYPEVGGLLPFGISDNGDLLMWKTVGEPNKWIVVLVESRMGQVEEFNMGLIDFLCTILKKDKKSRIFPPDFPSDAPQFHISGSTD